MQSHLVQRFRITSIQGPSARGTLEQFHDYIFGVEFDRGQPYKVFAGRVLVTLFDTAFLSLTHGSPRVPPFLEEGRARLAHFVVTYLGSLLPSTQPPSLITLNLTVQDVLALQSVDPSRVSASDWHDVPVQIEAGARRVFISCGQQSAEERQLGMAIALAAKARTGIDGYFAEYQHSFDELTRHIFNAIHSASAFIAVMHRRDKLSAGPEEYRGSVWIEQELAIAAFLVQSLGLKLPARLYVQAGVRREGVRGYIILNPIEFESAEDVLKDLESFWPEVS